MPAYRRYYDQLSYVKLYGKLTGIQLLDILLDGNKRPELENLKVRVVDGLEIDTVDFNEEQLRSFISVDRSTFVRNEALSVVLIVNDTFRPLFQSYVESMAATPWTFHIVNTREDAEELCQQYGQSFQAASLTVG